MAALKELVQTADWKKEKHVPAIDAPDKVKKGEPFRIAVTIGKEVAHPNTTEHHIAWVNLFFLADGEKFPVQIGRAEFASHGASAQGPNLSTLYTQPEASLIFRTEKSGTILAASYCNIHGLWESSKALAAV
jgi:superoxide reductase